MTTASSRRAGLAFGRGGWVVGLLGAVLVGCGGDPTGPSRNFMIRSPADGPHAAAVAAFSVSPTSTDSIDFAWDPASRATRYDIVFWQVESRDSMLFYRSDPAAPPSFRLPVDRPILTQMPVNTAQPDGPTVPAVAHGVAVREIDELLTAAGLEGNGPYYFVWSVYAEGGGQRVRSIARHRMVLQR